MPAGSHPERARYRVGRYVVTRRIGRGGMGMVYLGTDEALEREVAVKTLHVEGSLDADSRRRFEVEAKAAAKLQHPNIVTVFELGEDRGMPFIAMELLSGADLETVLRSGEPLLLAEKLDIVIQICRGLAFAHERGIVHRDMKPSNIRLLDDGTAKIMDFGIAKLGGTTLTKTGMMVGTIFYMSPEQVRGKGVDGRSDVFSVGVILHELLAGERPFRGEGPTDILYKIAHEPPDPLDAPALGLDPRLAEVVARCLEKDAERRFPSAEALAEALQPLLDAARREAQEGSAEALSAARRLMKEGRMEESLTALRSLAAKVPTSPEVRRALRAAVRERDRRSRPADEPSEEFPELEATYRASQTARVGETVVPLPTVALDIPATKVLAESEVQRAPGLPPPAPSRPLGMLVAVIGGFVLLGLGLGALLLRGSGPKAERESVASSAAAGQTILPGAASSPEPAPVASAPPRLPSRASSSPSTSGEPSPPRETASSPSPGLPAAAGASTEAPASVVTGPPAGVFIASAYPVDVTWRGRVLAKGEVSPRVQVSGGKQVLGISAPAHFLSYEAAVEAVPGGEVTVNTPGLGRLSIRANPDNCQVFIGGAFVDYPPILDKPVAAGKHVVGFKWPDGVEAREVAEVTAGKVAFVTGRKP